MRYLLDTHTLLWWLTDDPQLSPRAGELIGNDQNAILVSAASAWEIATIPMCKLPVAAALALTDLVTIVRNIVTNEIQACKQSISPNSKANALLRWIPSLQQRKP